MYDIACLRFIKPEPTGKDNIKVLYSVYHYLILGRIDKFSCLFACHAYVVPFSDKEYNMAFTT